MKAAMVIPSYWARERKVGWIEGDAVYDHPAPLDSEGTLLRAIRSIAILEDRDFQVVVLAVATSKDIEHQVEEKVGNIIKSASPGLGVQVSLFGNSHLAEMHDLLIRRGKKDWIDLLQLSGYSNVRNMCLFLPHILGSEIAMLIDDDEVFEDPDFVPKAKEVVGGSIQGKTVSAVAGYYLQQDGGYRLKKEMRPWMRYWDQYSKMNEAFDRFIGTEPRWKEAPFVFGGNMIIHRDLFTRVPFDPYVPRGEDIDFLINAKMFGYAFFIDNRLSIKHLPPPKTHPAWKRLREDIYRFVYERAKINNQEEREGMTRVSAETFDPYPGCFLKSDLEEKIESACKLMSEEYMAEGDTQGSDEALNNIQLAKTDAVPKFDPFERICELQKRWQALLEYTGRGEAGPSFRRLVE